MAERLRIGETRDALGNVLDVFDNGAAHVNPDWNKSGTNPNVVSLTPDEHECEIEAVEPGTINVLFTAEDAVLVDSPGVSATIPIEVLDATRFTFALTSPSNLSLNQVKHDGTVYDMLTPSSAPATVTLTATPMDELVSGTQPSAAYASGLTSIAWSRTGAAVSFNGSATATGSLTVTLRADEVGTSRVTLTAVNSVGQTITSYLDILVRGAAKATAEIIPPSE